MQPRTPELAVPRIDTAAVLSNELVCAEHLRLRVLLREFPHALAGQFVQLSPSAEGAAYANAAPFLPRAFSIGGLRRRADGVELDVIYRVVGLATGWMQALRGGDRINVMGPLGRPFRISQEKSDAVLVIGGVGLPPLLWLAEALQAAGKRTTAFVGARSRELVPLHFDDGMNAREFAALNARTVVATDDGSLGFSGTVVGALEDFWAKHPPVASDVVVYTCGPERMMRAAAEACAARGIECQVCMERPMACGVGTCQSCIVTVRCERNPAAHRFALCCSEGPVFSSDQIVW
jgi:dihydroorotate dehydrogenase electron transfer subunit